MVLNFNENIKYQGVSIKILPLKYEEQEKYIKENDIAPKHYFRMKNCLILLRSPSYDFTSMIKLDSLLIFYNSISKKMSVYVIYTNSYIHEITPLYIHRKVGDLLYLLELKRQDLIFKEIKSLYGNILKDNDNLKIYQGAFSGKFIIDFQTEKYICSNIDETVISQIMKDENINFVKLVAHTLL